MRDLRRILPTFSLLIATFLLAFTSIASAHVVVKPGDVQTSSFQTFTIGVPNEKSVSVVGIRLLVPSSLKYVQPTVKQGWTIETKKSGTGEHATITELSWTGGSIPAEQRDDFTFSAQAPADPSKLEWKAYQTYSDGTVASWDQAEESNDKDKGPFSVTNVVNETESDSMIRGIGDDTADALNAANQAKAFGVAGIAVGLIAVYLASRRKS